MTPLMSVRDLRVTFDVPRPGAMPWTPARLPRVANCR